MSPEIKKSISNIATAGAFIMAISCTIKITAFHFGLPIVSQWVNVIINAMIVYGCYKLGKIAELSRSHKLLCATAILGYIFYSIILVFIPEKNSLSVSASVLIFFFITLVMALWFLFDLMHNDLKKTEEELKTLEKELEE